MRKAIEPGKRKPQWMTRALCIGVLVVSQFALDQGVTRLTAGWGDDEKTLLRPLYHQIITLDYRKPKVNRCSIVRMRRPAEQAAIDMRCANRRRIAEVLNAVTEARPEAIVMNYTFDKDGGCRPELDELEQGVRTACAAERVPVILGFRIEKNKTIPPHLAAGMDINQRCATGALNIRSDLRMIPLRFYINDASKPTLAWSAATAVNPRLVQDPVLADDSVADKSLYTTLLTEAELADFTVDDEDVLAGSASGRLRGRVVIIGSPQNTFPTYAGNVPGYVLQASYIEALLDGRYLQRMPFFFHVAVALAFWIYLELGESVRTKLVRMAGGLAAILVLSWLTVHLFGYYSDFLMISMGGVFTWLFEVATKQFRERRPA